jgi:hypothetical protein
MTQDRWFLSPVVVPEPPPVGRWRRWWRGFYEFLYDFNRY